MGKGVDKMERTKNNKSKDPSSLTTPPPFRCVSMTYSSSKPAWFPSQPTGKTSDVLALLLLPLVPFVTLALLLGAEKLEKGLDP